ncbi:MAG: TVP38/TMEM64 family protein [Candidatus Lokiarchaeia archaeon]
MYLPALFVTLSVLDGINAFFQNLFNGVLWWIVIYGSIGFFAAMILQAIIAPIPSELVLMLGGAAFSIQYNAISLIPLIVLFPEIFNFFTLIFYLPLFSSLFTFDYGILLAGFVGGTGEVAGGVIGFYIARFVGRPVIERWENEAIGMEKKDYVPSGGRLRRFFDKTVIYVLGDAVLIADRWFTKYGFWAVLAARLIPLVLFDAVSYGAGLTKIKFRSYFIPTVIGGYPRAFLYCFFGAKLLIYLNYVTFGNPYTLFFIIIALVVVLVAVIYEFVIKRRYLVTRNNTNTR